MKLFLTSGFYKKTKYIIYINSNQEKDTHITRGFHGLLAVHYKNINVLKRNLINPMKKDALKEYNKKAMRIYNNLK